MKRAAYLCMAWMDVRVSEFAAGLAAGVVAVVSGWSSAGNTALIGGIK